MTLSTNESEFVAVCACVNTLTLECFRAWWDIFDHVLVLCCKTTSSSVSPWQPCVRLEELSGDAFILSDSSYLGHHITLWWVTKSHVMGLYLWQYWLMYVSMSDVLWVYSCLYLCVHSVKGDLLFVVDWYCIFFYCRYLGKQGGRYKADIIVCILIHI